MKNINKAFQYAVLVLGLLLSLWAGVVYDSTFVEAQEMDQKTGHLQERFLKANGKVLRNQAGKGDIVTLRGTNVGGWQVMEAWMCPTNAADQKTTLATLSERFGEDKAEELIKVYEEAWWQEQDFDNAKELNFNVLRLPISYFSLLDREGTLRLDTLATLDWFVEECEKREIYVILDLHAAPGSQNGRDHSGDKSSSILFTEEKLQTLTISLWEQLALHYKGNPTIAGYDLLNEPEGNDSERAPWGKVQLPFYDRLYKAIRAIDADHLILFGAIWEPADMPDPSEYGWENVMYEYHFYCWEGTDQVSTQNAFTKSKVTKNNKEDFNVPVLIGEFTLFEKLPSWEYALITYEQNGWSWTTWTYKTVGMGSWGIYNSTTSTTPKVNIYTDSEEDIREKWSKVATASSFTENKSLHDLLKTMADPDKALKETRKWYQNCELEEVILRAGTQARALVVDSEETHSGRKGSKVISLTVTGAEKIPTATSRNVCIAPAIRDSVDASGMDYLIIDTYAMQGDKSLQVTLVDKNGTVWSEYTSSEAMPVAGQWTKIFVDLRKATLDISAIIEIRIGVNVSGTYYFDDIIFAKSYIAPLPTESVQEMRNDMGVPGKILDWTEADTARDEKSYEKPYEKLYEKLFENRKVSSKMVFTVAIIGIVLLILCFISIRIFRRNKND